jgi:hypothetical protein
MVFITRLLEPQRQYAGHLANTHGADYGNYNRIGDCISFFQRMVEAPQIDRFMSEYQKLRENELGANEAHDVLKAYVGDFNVQMNATPKMDKFVRKCLFLNDLQKWVVDVLFKFRTFSEDMAGIIEIAKRIKAHGPKRKSSRPA